MRKLLIAFALSAYLPFIWNPLRGQSPSVRIETSKEKPRNTYTGGQSSEPRGTEGNPFVIDVSGHHETPIERQERKKQADKAAAEEDYHRGIDRWMLRWTATAAIATGILVLVGIGGTIAAICTIREIRKQTQATRDSVDAFVASERPWLSIEVSPASEIRFDSLGIVCDVDIQITNIGNTPACSVDVWPVIYCLGGQRTAVAKREELVDILKKGRAATTEITILPGEKEFIPKTPLLAQDNTRGFQTMQEISGSPGNVICAVAIVCVGYRRSVRTDADPARPYCTAAIYNVWKATPYPEGERLVPFPPYETVPRQIVVMKKPVANAMKAE
jgi:hypothetical protein